MSWDLGKIIFPKADPWDRRRKMDILFFSVTGGLLLVGVVVYVLVSISHSPGGRSASSAKPPGFVKVRGDR